MSDIKDPFSALIGNEEVKGYLKTMLAKQMVGHSFLFSGQSGIGKSKFAEALADALISQGAASEMHQWKIKQGVHPDLHHLRPEGKIAMHSMESLKAFIKEVHYPPHEAPKKVFIIHEADRMLPTSANALLKTFEEPSPNTLIILLSSHKERLLSTIVSRCRRVQFRPLSNLEMLTWLQKTHQLELEEARKIAAFAGGSFSRAEQILNQEETLIEKSLLETLAKGPFSTYEELRQTTNSLADSIVARKEAFAEEAKENLLPRGFEELSATQKEIILKEVDGAVSCQYHADVDAFFHTLISWYRDCHLLQNQGDRNLLHHVKWESALTEEANRSTLPSLKEVLFRVNEAKLSIQRFSSLAAVLESLFLRLNFSSH